jgi:hypothetical protein
MLNRRSFMGTLGGFGMLTSAAFTGAAAEKRRIFVLEHYYLKNGTQAGRMHEYCKAAIATLRRIHSGPKLFLEAVVASHMPQVAVILGFESLDELWSIRAKAHDEGDLTKAFEAWENHAEQPYEHFSTVLLEATDYCPAVKEDPAPRQNSRIFELRTYHAPTYRQLKALHERFAGPEIRIFHRSGVHPILYTSTLIGPSMPNLTYVIPFESLADREKAWTAFGADPEWIKVRAESIEKHGQISSTSQISLWRATPYSPIR